MTLFSRRDLGRIALAGAATLAAPAIVNAKAKGRLVIIGGGFGGASAARFARINYPHIAVTLIEPQTTFVTCPYGNLLLEGGKTLADITHSYDGLKRRGVKVIHDWADSIDAAGKKVKLRGGATVAYDKLIVSPGIAIKWGALSGYDRGAEEDLPARLGAREGRAGATAPQAARSAAGRRRGRLRHSGQPLPLPARPL